MINDSYSKYLSSITKYSSKWLSITRHRPHFISDITNKLLRVFFVNCRSLRNKLVEFEILLSSIEFDVLCFVETFSFITDSNTILLFNCNYYTLFREFSHVGRGGGVAIFVRNDLFPKRINLVQIVNIFR